MTNIKYNPQTLKYEVCAGDLIPELKVYRNLLIEDINNIQLKIAGEPISEKQFEYYQRSTTAHLESIVLDQSAVLNRKNYDQNNDHN